MSRGEHAQNQNDKLRDWLLVLQSKACNKKDKRFDNLF